MSIPKLTVIFSFPVKTRKYEDGIRDVATAADRSSHQQATDREGLEVTEHNPDFLGEDGAMRTGPF
jgi:hypothetical protein